MQPSEQTSPDMAARQARVSPGRRGTLAALSRITAQVGAAERRQVTVLFCDIVGSSGLAARLDPEDVTSLLVSYRRQVTDVVRQHGGYVARFIGDGILAYWGYPCSQADDARLAVSAALAIITALDGQIDVRCGIDTGIVVVGRIGDASATELEVVGRAPNTAAHLQATAPSNAVLVTNTVQALTSDAVEFTPHSLGRSSKSSCIRAWRALRPKPGWQSSTRSSGAMIGREADSARLESAIDEATRGLARVMVIRGEDGIGKSMLVGRAISYAAAGSAECFEVECRPERQCVTLHAVRDLLRQLLRRVAEHDAGAPLAVTDSLRLVAGDDNHDIALLESFLSPAPARDDRPPAAAQSPDRLLRLVLGIFARRAVAHPIIIAIEDIHWADEATLQFLADAAAAYGPGHRICIMLTTRSAPASGSALHRLAVDLPIRRLSNEEIARVLSHQPIAAPIEADLSALIVQRAEGHPLFAIELARLAAEPQGRRSLDGLLAAPSTLNSALTTRLDRLGALKPLAQAAALLGRRFNGHVLAEVLGLEYRVLKPELGRLIAQGIIEAIGPQAPATYRFNHALVRDAAHASILRENRRALHRRAAEVLIECFPTAACASPEAVAAHATAGGDCATAFQWWKRAALHAMHMSATPAAVRHLERALAVGLAAQEPCSVADEIDVLRLLGPQLAKLRGCAAPEVRETYLRGLALTEQLVTPDPAAVFDLLCGLQSCFIACADLPQTRTISDKLHTLAAASGVPSQRAVAHMRQGMITLLTGDLAATIEEFSAARGLDGSQPDDRPAGATDTNGLALAYEALALAFAGRLTQSDALARSALAHIECLRQPHTSAHITSVLAVRSQLIGDRTATAALSAAARGLGERFGYPSWTATAMVIEGWLDGARNPNRGVETIRAGIARFRSQAAEQMLPYGRLLLAETLLRAGRPVAASAVATEALRHAEYHGLLLLRPHLLHVAAMAAKASRDPVAAAMLLAAAAEHAESQGAALIAGRVHAELETINSACAAAQPAAA